MRKIAILVSVFVIAGLAGCSSDKSTPATNTDKPDATPVVDSGPPPLSTDWPTSADAGKADCTAARWPGFSEECWSCLCDACPAQLDTCDTACTGVFECSIENQTLGNTSPDTTCEVLLTGKACVKSAAQVQGSFKFIGLDGCLLGSAKKKAGEFRTCDTACGIHYPGNICARNNSKDAG